MKKHLNFLCFLSILFLYGCGFEPILSSKNVNRSYVISIDEINFKNYNELNNLFLRKFRYYQKSDEDLKKFNITLDVNKTKRRERFVIYHICIIYDMRTYFKILIYHIY